MPTATNDGVSLYYETAGPEDGETVAFVADTGYGAWQWGWQHDAIAGPFRTLIWNNRGTGESDSPPGPYAVEEMAGDLEAVLADCGVRKVHLVGAGMGGMIALRYALDHSRARTLTLLGTSPGGPRAVETPADVRERLLVENRDREAFRDSLRPVLSREFLETDDLVSRIVDWRLAEDASPAAQRAQTAAVDGFDASDRLYEVAVPALVVHGTDDRVFPVENGRLLADQLPKGEFRELDDAPHLAFVERSKEVNDELLGFLDEHAERSPD